MGHSLTFVEQLMLQLLFNSVKQYNYHDVKC